MLETTNYMTLQRIAKVLKTINKMMENATDAEEREELEEDQALIKEVIDSMIAYTEYAFLDEEQRSSLGKLKEETNSIEEYQDAIIAADARRRGSHNALILAVGVADRICKLYGCEPIYGQLGEFANNTSKLTRQDYMSEPKVFETRNKLALWAFDFVLFFSSEMEEKLSSISQSDENPEAFINMMNEFGNVNPRENINKAIEKAMTIQ